MRNLQKREPIDIVIPTYENLSQLQHCLHSMSRTRCNYPIRFVIVNNGRSSIREYIPSTDEFVVIDMGSNLGWTGGLAEGLKHSKSEYVMFANDDIYIPKSSFKWLVSMSRHLDLLPNVAAVGPSSNIVMGRQNIWANGSALTSTTPFLIGLCILLRRKAIDEVGGIDINFNTGDDIDLCIRLQKAGYGLIIDSSVFVYHHGFQTGERIYGTPDGPGGWNSQKMTDDTNMALIRKHGFMEWWITMTGQEREGMKALHRMREHEIVNKHLNGARPDEVLEVGCGSYKTVEGSMGIDVIPKGERYFGSGEPCIADMVANTENELPFEDGAFKLIIARHILEHCVDTVKVLENWYRVLSRDGRAIICCPDERTGDSIILNPEHVHAFTPESLGKIAKTVGYKVDSIDDFYDYDSFTMVLSKDISKEPSSSEQPDWWRQVRDMGY